MLQTNQLLEHWTVKELVVKLFLLISHFNFSKKIIFIDFALDTVYTNLYRLFWRDTMSVCMCEGEREGERETNLVPSADGASRCNDPN